MMNLKKKIEKIENHEILIPDFQRGFVWKDLEMQKRLIASVLAKLPIGSILLLDGDPKEFQSKKIGRKNTFIVEGNETKQYLLDGQQRMTVLTNVFSNTILKDGRLSELISISLKNRFFLQMPPCRGYENNDLFGLNSFIFPFYPKEEPNFLAHQVYESIIVETSVNHEVLSSDFKLDSLDVERNIVNYCTKDAQTTKIPLVLLGNSKGNVLIKNIVGQIADFREEYLAKLINSYFREENPEDIDKFIEAISNLNDKTYIDRFHRSRDEALGVLSKLKSIWEKEMTDYLFSTIEDLNLSKIEVPNSQRARAIDIYENLNKGGVTLSTFDLIVAKTAQIDSVSLTEKIINEISCNKEIVEILPNVKYVHDKSMLFESMGLYNDRRNEFSSTFLNVFLNLLSITVITKNNNDSKVNLSYVKREAVLNLKPQEIHENYIDVIKGIKRAMLFMHARLGIRKISDIKYEHVLLNLSRVFINDLWWNNNRVFNKLEYWYWIVVFSGAYDKDQSSQMVIDMNVLDKFLKDQVDFEDQYFEALVERIFAEHYFTRKDILLMEQVELNNIPKRVVRDLIIQYTLSRYPSDFIKDEQGKQVFLAAYDDIDKEMHHIIPLHSATNIGESTKKLRLDDEHYLNSPLNYTIISSIANKKIAGESLNSYISRLPEIASGNHFIPELNLLFEDPSNDSFHKEVLSGRYHRIRDDIISKLNSLKN